LPGHAVSSSGRLFITSSIFSSHFDDATQCKSLSFLS
jgi:hypothetical protein